MRYLRLATLSVAVYGGVRSGSAQTPTFKKIHQFTGPAYPHASLVIDRKGILYGTTSYNVFELKPSPSGVWKEKNLYNVATNVEQTPVTIGARGELYGTVTPDGCNSSGCGVVFMLTPPTAVGASWTETTLHSFMNSPDGAFPFGGVTVGPDGTLYGTTYGGGLAACGVIYSLAPPSSPGGAWTASVLHGFSCPPGDGWGPVGNLVLAGDGTLYGVTSVGGSSTECQYGCGTVFSLTPPAAPGGSWTEAVLYNFSGLTPDGAGPNSIVMAANGTIYGATNDGGEGEGGGMVFELAPPSVAGGTWTETVIHAFVQGGKSGGSRPYGGVILGPNGVLYGTNYFGGKICARGPKKSCGNVFQLTPPPSPGGAWKETILHQFTGKGDGANPAAGMVMGPNGVLYGTTFYNDAGGDGTVFKLKP